MKIFRRMLVLVVLSGQIMLAQEWKPNFSSLEFEDVGISIEVPSDWYAMNNGALRMIRKVAAELLKEDHDETNLLISMLDRNDIEDKTASLLNIHFLPDFMLTQREVADASPDQVDVILEALRSHWFEEMKKIASSARLVNDGEVLKIGTNWYARLTMEVQMREDLPMKTKEMFFHMSDRGIVIIGFTRMRESEKRIIPIRDYVLESLRTNALRRTQ
jgi:hypothetical protein